MVLTFLDIYVDINHESIRREAGETTYLKKVIMIVKLINTSILPLSN